MKQIIILLAALCATGAAGTKTVGPNGEGVNASTFRSAIGAPATGDIPTWSTLSGKPSTFPAEWSTISGKPSTFPAEWSTLSGKPAVSLSGIGSPALSTGENGQYYVNALTGDRWKKVDGAWLPVSLRRPFLNLLGEQNNFDLPTLTCYAAAYSAGMVPIHPSVVKFETAWNGYKYWMAYTPYGTSGQQYENPCLACSTDGYTWINVPGVTNPLAAYPGAGKYNSDTNLFAKNGTLYLTWRETAGGGEIIRGISSTNGVTWSASFVVIDNSSAGRASNIIAQSIFPADGGGYEMWATDSLGTNGTTVKNTLKRYTAPALTGPWTFASTAILKNAPADIPGSSYYPELWHADVHKINGQWIALFPYSNGSGNHVGSLYFAESTDGVNFNMLASSLPARLRNNTTTNGMSYKSCFWLDADSAGVPCIRFLLGNAGDAGTSGISNALAYFKMESASAEFTRKLSDAVSKYDNYVVADNFTRADAANLGSTSTGQTWTYPSGTGFAIVSNKAVINSTANNIALIDSGVSDGVVSMRFASRAGDNNGLVFRAVNNDDFWKITFDTSNRLYVQKVVGGSATTTTLYEIPANNAEVLSVHLNGSLIIVYCDNIEVFRVTDSTGSTRTKHGIYGRIANTTVDGFFVEKL